MNRRFAIAVAACTLAASACHTARPSMEQSKEVAERGPQPEPVQMESRYAIEAPASNPAQPVARDEEAPAAPRTVSPPKMRESKRDHGRAAGFRGLELVGQGRGGGGTGHGDGHGVIASGSPQYDTPPPADREAYAHTPEADWSHVVDKPLSTFSADVDTASYSNVRRMLRSGRLPPVDAVRVEEMLNYFDYDYGEPEAQSPFAVHTEVSDCPWNPAHRLVHVGLRTAAIDASEAPARNLVFLIDVSGSMSSPDKLPLLKRGLALLARNLRPEDSLAIAVYAGASGLALESTRGDETGKILDALARLEAGGSTAGAAGIQLAYQVASQHFVKDGINRVILATDGDFNVGASSQGELARLIEQKRKTGVFLTVLGFGQGNLQDSRMETLADKGNGNYAYIDSEAEAQKVLVREAGSTLVTVAKDVKLQVEFNPGHVERYRLIGYENRTLAARDFNDDEKDAGDVGAGHSVTVLYEVVPAGGDDEHGEVDALRYQSSRDLTTAADSGELMTLKVRYKSPAGSKSRLREYTVVDSHRALDSASDAFRFAAAVAGFGLKLRHSPHVVGVPTERLLSLAAGSLGEHPQGDRQGLLELMQLAAKLGLDG